MLGKYTSAAQIMEVLRRLLRQNTKILNSYLENFIKNSKNIMAPTPSSNNSIAKLSRKPLTYTTEYLNLLKNSATSDTLHYDLNCEYDSVKKFEQYLFGGVKK